MKKIIDSVPDKFDQLKFIIATLQERVSLGKVTFDLISETIEGLIGINKKYKYSNEDFPALKAKHTYAYEDHNVPENFAEAVLWKLGRWDVYKKFAKMYVSEQNNKTKSPPDNKGVVLYAFVKHLVDNSNPIYDQHALRALWAICKDFNSAEEAVCESALFKNDKTWKPTMSGGDAGECYDLFVSNIKRLEKISDGVTLMQLDHLLMPLGQAIKEIASNYSRFQELCGRPITK